MEVKTKIIETAFSLLASNNFEAISMKEIHYAIGVSRGTLYNYFRGRDEIFKEIVDLYLMPIFSESLTSVKNAQSIYQAILESVKIKYNLLMKIKSIIQTNQNLLLFMNQAYLFDNNMEERIKRSLLMEITEWEKLINFAIDKKEIRSDVDPKVISRFLTMTPINYFIFMFFSQDFRYDDLKRNLMIFYDNIKL